MIDVTNPNLYNAALQALSTHAHDVGLRGRFVQIFLALKYHQAQIPTAASGAFISTAVLQGMIDDLFSKASRPATNCVLSMFNSNYLARTGISAPGQGAQNTWRNNFNLQKGVGCFADAPTLADPVFRALPRHACPALVRGPGGALAGAQCGLSPSGASYRGEEHSKWLKIDPGGLGYAAVDPLDRSLYLPYVAPNGNRLPFVPLVVALYHDAMQGLITATRPAVDVQDFASDFNLSATELSAYFDDSPAYPANQYLHNMFPSLTKHTPFAAVTPLVVTAVPSVTPASPPTPALPPAVNHGWHAEQYVEQELAAAGWQVYNVSRQRLGFDLIAQMGRRTRYIEVKSSIGLCSPTLTMREWQQALAHQGNYVLAVLENFNSTGANQINWVPDPASLPATPALVQEYAIGRTDWAGACVPFGSI